jgi:Zinc-binding dehydrogenase
VGQEVGVALGGRPGVVLAAGGHLGHRLVEDLLDQVVLVAVVPVERGAKAAGATVIGAASRAKLDAVTGFGADRAVDYGAAGWAEQVRELTGGRGATLVLDAVGGPVAASAFAAAADGAGRIGLYGYASGSWPALDLQAVARRGLTLCGPLGMVIRKSDAEQRDDAERALAAAARGELTSLGLRARWRQAGRDLPRRHSDPCSP